MELQRKSTSNLLKMCINKPL